jgi:peptide/nickel transport system substrate-binding protein
MSSLKCLLVGGFLFISLLSRGLARAALTEDGPVVVGQTFLASSMDPTGGSDGWALTSHGVAEKLFTVDKNDLLVGQVAESVTKVSEFVWEFVLKSDYSFSDGTVVNAEHVAACLMDLNTKNAAAQSSLGDMAVTAVDDVTVRIESDRATHVMNAVLAEWVFVIYVKDSEGKFFFTGPYMIETFGEDQIVMIPNNHYPDHHQRPHVTVKKYADGEALADAVMNKEVDIAFHLPPDRLAELRDVEGVNIKSFEVGYHYMMFYNIDTLQDLRVRKAIDLVLDRNELSQALSGGTGTRSLFPDFSPYFVDESDANRNEDAAATLLVEAEWVLEASGKLVKDGKALSIELVAYPHRPDLAIMQPIIEEALTSLGMTVTTVLTGDDWDETQLIIDERSFDLLLWAQHTLPAGDPLWFLSSFFRSDGGNNHANFTSATVDSLLDELSVTEDFTLRVASAAKAHSAILEQVPVSNLITPTWHVGLSERMADYEPYGSDYYVIRADLMIPAKEESTPSGSCMVGQCIQLLVSLFFSAVLLAVNM